MTRGIPTFDERWKERCKICRYLDSYPTDPSGVMRCSGGRRRPMPYCIDQRDHDGECGPTAKLWAPLKRDRR